MQCLEIQVGHLGWDSLQGRTFTFRHILGDVCMWDHYMLTEISAFMFNIVCTAQCKSLEDKQETEGATGQVAATLICVFGILQSAVAFSSCVRRTQISKWFASKLSTFMQMSWTSEGFPNGICFQCFSSWVLPCLSPISSAGCLLWSDLRHQSHCIICIARPF